MLRSFCVFVLLLLQGCVISFKRPYLCSRSERINRALLCNGKDKIPEHIAFICDGNGRWGVDNKLTRKDGHKKGANVTVEIVKSSFEQGSRIVSLYLFSTENWSRPMDEIMYIFNLLGISLNLKIIFF